MSKPAPNNKPPAKPDIKTNPSGKHRVLISLKDRTNKRYWSSHLNYPFDAILKTLHKLKKSDFE